MSLIPFILELADELHEFNRCLATGGMDVDDFGFGIYPHELQPQQQQQSPPQQQQQQSQHPLQQQPAQQQHLSQQQQQQRRPRTLSQFYWLPNISKSRHHPYYRGKPCCNKTPIHLVHDHQLEKESSSTAGGGGGGGGAVGVINSGSTIGITAGDKESTTTTTTTSAHATNSSSSANTTGNSSAGKSAYSVVNKNGFQVSMNVKQFAPNELTVKTIDNCIVVEGQHEDKEDGHGVISRHFIRKYMLPKGYDPSEVLSTLSSDGILTVKAPPPALKTDETMERIVDIQQTGGTVQVQQSAAKEPPNSAVASSAKEAQTTAAAAVVEQTVATAAAAAAGSLPTAVATTLQKQQQQPEPQQKQQKQQQPQQLSATVEDMQQQQQQPTKLSQATTKDLQVTRERNGKLEPNELLAEQETETRTAEQTATSSNTNNIAANNNNNNNNSTNSNNNSGVINIECSELKVTATSKATQQTEVQEQECAVEDAEQTPAAAIDNVNNKMPHASDATKSSSTIDAIMADATADEPMETEEELEAVTKQEVVAQKPIVVSIPTADVEADTATANNTDVVVVNSATVTATAATTNNNTTSNDIVTPPNDAVGTVEANGIEINTANNIDIELAPATITEAPELVLVTNNGVSDDKTAPTGDGLTISLETTVAEIDGVTDMDTDVAEVTDAVVGVVDADGLDGGVIAIGVDIGVGVDVNVITADGNNATAQNAEVVHEENLSAGNLVVAAQSPTPADLVAAADAAILLAKTQCDGGAGDVAASKPALTTEEITN